MDSGLDPQVSFTSRLSTPNPPFSAKYRDDPALESRHWDQSQMSCRSIDCAFASSMHTASRPHRCTGAEVTRPIPLTPRSYVAEVAENPWSANSAVALMPRQILPSQTSYARRFEGDSGTTFNALSARPHFAYSINVSAPQSGDDLRTATSFPNSVVYGSDIIRREGAEDATKRRSSLPSLNDTTPQSSYPTSIARDSLISSPERSLRRYSLASISVAIPRKEERPVVRQVSREKSDASSQSNKPARWPMLDHRNPRRHARYVSDGTSVSSPTSHTSVHSLYQSLPTSSPVLNGPSASGMPCLPPLSFSPSHHNFMIPEVPRIEDLVVWRG